MAECCLIICSEYVTFSSEFTEAELDPRFFGLQQVLSQVLQEAGYTKESYLMLDDFIKVLILYICVVTIETSAT